MTTSQQNTFLSDLFTRESIPIGKLAYFRGRLSNRIHELVLEAFAHLEAAGGITRADLARRIGKKPEQITRWLGNPGNWESDTVSDLLLGMGFEPRLSLIDLRKRSFIAAEEFAQLPSLTSLRAANDPQKHAEEGLATRPQAQNTFQRKPELAVAQAS